MRGGFTRARASCGGREGRSAVAQHVYDVKIDASFLSAAAAAGRPSVFAGLHNNNNNDYDNNNDNRGNN